MKSGKLFWSVVFSLVVLTMMGVLSRSTPELIVDNETVKLDYSLNCSLSTPISIVYFTTPKEALVSIEVFNKQGIKVNEIINENLISGYHQVVFDKYNLQTGEYILCLSAKDETGNFRMEKSIQIN